MRSDDAGLGGLGEAVVFLRFFEDLPDPRQRAKVLYPLDEVLLLCLLAVLAGAETMAGWRYERPSSAADQRKQAWKLIGACNARPGDADWIDGSRDGGGDIRSFRHGRRPPYA